MDKPEFHQVVIATEGGVNIYSKVAFLPSESDAMKLIYKNAIKHPGTIAAFWYVNGGTVEFYFGRA